MIITVLGTSAIYMLSSVAQHGDNQQLDLI